MIFLMQKMLINFVEFCFYLELHALLLQQPCNVFRDNLETTIKNFKFPNSLLLLSFVRKKKTHIILMLLQRFVLN